MSVEFMSKVWKDAPYHGNKLLCLLACADWANDEGEFFPSYNKIAAKLRMERRSAIRLLSGLIEDGAVSRIHRKTKSINSSNLFKLHTENFPQIKEKYSDPPVTLSSSNLKKVVTRQSPGSDPSVTGDSDSSVTHIHHVEPSLDTSLINLPKAVNLSLSPQPSPEIVEPSLANSPNVDSQEKPAAPAKAKAARKPQIDSGEGKASTPHAKTQGSPVSASPSTHQVMMATLAEVTGQPIVTGAAQGSAIKKILKYYTAEQGIEVLHWMADPKTNWRGKVDWLAVQSFIPEYFRRKTQQQQPPQEPKPNGISTTKRDFSRIIANLPEHLR